MVELALRRPYTFIVMAMLILLATPFALLNMATDIFPEINIPVISVIWNYNGLSAQEMGQRIAGQNERGLTTTVSDIEHIESQSLASITIIKIFFQPGANIQTAIAQVVAAEQTQVRQLPPGITPPLVIKYSASSIPVVQLGLSSATLPEQSLFDTAVNVLRPQLITIPGVAVPFPYGGKNRVISVDLDTAALQARGLAPADVVNAVNLQNLILPSGTAKFGETEYTVKMNGSPDAIAGLNDLPIRTINGVTTYIRDVAYVRDGYSPQTNIVRQDGARGVLLSVLKNGGASTLDIVANLKALLPRVAETVPKEIKITPLFDQSVFVKAAVKGVVAEALIAAALTAAMVLLFLGNWRSTLIIALTIPLSILASILALQMLGETLNLMTLGGLALSVGILVDQAIVTIENIERHLHVGEPLRDAIVVGAGEIGVPAFVSTLCICVVFVPMFFLSGVARFLFVPLAEAVVFAMVASYLLSRTLVPTLVMLLMRNVKSGASGGGSLLQRLYRAFDQQFERVRTQLHAHAVRPARSSQGVRIAVLRLLRPLLPSLPGARPRFLSERGRRADPAAHARAHRHPDRGNGAARRRSRSGDPAGRSAGSARDDPRQSRRSEQRHQPFLQQCGDDRHAGRRDSAVAARRPPADRRFRHATARGTAAPVSRHRVLLPAGRHHHADPELRASRGHRRPVLRRESRRECGARGRARQVDPRDSRCRRRPRASADGCAGAQSADGSHAPPAARPDGVQRRTERTGVAVRQHADCACVLAESGQRRRLQRHRADAAVRRGFARRAAQHARRGRGGAQAGGSGTTQLLGNLVEAQPDRQIAIASRYNITPAVDLYVSVQGSDLASVAAKVKTLVDDMRPRLPRGSQINLRGQVQTMQSSFIGLGVGLAMAIVLVYLLVVVNFQSWIDAAIIVAALPAALAGIAWMLFITGTTLSVPALTGAIMTMGVATANSILLVSFARQRKDEGAPILSAALEAGATRIRPVLMTALAMVIGMVPMALGIGEGAEQNAPLGRAVIGGLLFATVSTLFFVPVVYAGVHRYLAQRAESRVRRPPN